VKATEWARIKHFTSDTYGIGDPDRIRIEIMRPLDMFAGWLEERGKRIVLHCGYQNRRSGFHPKGLAVDFHIPGMGVIDQYLAAERFDAFNGLGIYPDWNSPGLHADSRPKDSKLAPDARWGCKLVNGKQKYVALDEAFIRYCLDGR
jgi:uncharacterized protein YcbK (DUF882 family)